MKRLSFQTTSPKKELDDAMEEMNCPFKMTIREETDHFLYHQGLYVILEAYSQPFIGGSYAYDLMTWRDLDIYFKGDFDLQAFFNLGYKITAALKAYKSRFRR